MQHLGRVKLFIWSLLYVPFLWGQYPDVHFLSGKFLSGHFLSGQFLSGHFLSGQFLFGQFVSGHFLSCQFVSGQFVFCQFLFGQYICGQYCMMHIQNVPRQNVPGTKRPKGQNVPRGQMRPIIEQGVASYLIQYGQDKGKT